MNKLLARKIYKSYGNKFVLKGVSLEVKSGEIVALLGPNGAGKTTFFYSLVGLVSVNSGRVSLNRVNITHYPIYLRGKMGIGYLPQENSIFRGLTVAQNILAILERIEKNKKRQERLDELLEEFSITHIKNSNALSLSGGERRRVEIARCLANKPDFVLLDEPFAGVDPIAVSDIKELITVLKNKNIGVVITDHNVRETLAIVDRAYIIYDGKVLIKGSKDEIIQNPKVREVYLGKEFSI